MKVQPLLIRVIKKEDLEEESTFVIHEDNLISVDRSWFTQEGEASTQRTIDVRHGGPLKNKAFILSDQFNWVTGIDCYGCKVLIPLPR